MDKFAMANAIGEHIAHNMSVNALIDFVATTEAETWAGLPLEEVQMEYDARFPKDE